jgi:polyhydroxyalkanoate synthesis regulator phasin
MGLFKQAEFAQKCNIQQAYLTMNRKRGKVIVNEEGMVDDANAINVLFMERCLSRVPKEPKEKPDVSEEPVKIKKAQKAQIIEKKSKSSSSKAAEKADERFDLDTEKRKMEIEKIRRETRLADIQHEKMIGKMLPTEPIKSIFIQTIKAYTVSFTQAANKILQEFAKRNKMNRNDVAEMRGELIAAINQATKEGTDQSQKAVNHIIREYSQSKKV